MGTKAGIKGASVTMGYLETGMQVWTLPLRFFPDCKSLLFWVRMIPTRLITRRSTWKRKPLQMSLTAMTTSTYKGRDVFNETAGSLYVAMGGRDQEMTFGGGTIDYSDMYVESAYYYWGGNNA